MTAFKSSFVPIDHAEMLVSFKSTEISLICSNKVTGPKESFYSYFFKMKHKYIVREVSEVFLSFFNLSTNKFQRILFQKTK